MAAAIQVQKRRKCDTCGKEKPLNARNFHPLKNRQDFETSCVPCKKAVQAQAEKLNTPIDRPIAAPDMIVYDERTNQYVHYTPVRVVRARSELSAMLVLNVYRYLHWIVVQKEQDSEYK